MLPYYADCIIIVRVHAMTRYLGGWWRLWIVLAVIYGGLIAAYTWLSWPVVSHVSHAPGFLKRMSPEALAVVNRPKTLLVPRVLSMPNGYEIEVRGDTKLDEINLVGLDYVRVLRSVVSERRIAALRNALLIWLVPSILVCVLGFAVAWVFRGFKRGHREP